MYTFIHLCSPVFHAHRFHKKMQKNACNVFLGEKKPKKKNHQKMLPNIPCTLISKKKYAWHSMRNCAGNGQVTKKKWKKKNFFYSKNAWHSMRKCIWKLSGIYLGGKERKKKEEKCFFLLKKYMAQQREIVRLNKKFFFLLKKCMAQYENMQLEIVK